VATYMTPEEREAAKRLDAAEERLYLAGRAMLVGKQDQFNTLCDAAVEYTRALDARNAARKAAEE
jgi:hypothetical protein